MIMHIDMDAFFASVEQQINPKLKNKPVIVGARDQKYKTVVAAASYEAKAFGITSGMPTWQAFKICPHAEFVPADSSKYTHVSHKIFELLKDYSPFVKHATIDEFDLELDGLEPFFGTFLNMGQTIKNKIREVFGLNCSAGIAPTWILAKLGSKIRKPDGLILINQENLDELIKNVSIDKVCGIGPSLTRHLQNLGILTCGQLKSVPENLLIDNFGQTTGHWLYAILRTAENMTWQKGQISLSDIPKSVSHSYTLPVQINDQRTILAWLKMLSEMVAERSRKYGILGRTISLWISSRNESFLKQKTFWIPTHDGSEIFTRAKGILSERKHKILGVRALGVHLSGLLKNTAPPLLHEQKRREALLETMDLINSKHGDWTISPASLTMIGQIKK